MDAQTYVPRKRTQAEIAESLVQCLVDAAVEAAALEKAAAGAPEVKGFADTLWKQLRQTSEQTVMHLRHAGVLND